MKNIVLLIIYVLSNSVACSNVIVVFKCTADQRCEREYSRRNDTRDFITYFNLNHCRLVCGRYGPLWPRPTGTVYIDKETTPIDLTNIRFDHISFNQSVEGKRIIKETTKYFLRNLRRECAASCDRASGVPLLIQLNVTSESTDLDWYTDESYNLTLALQHPGTLVAMIQANTVFGARHGCETLLQLTAIVRDNLNSTNTTFHMLSRATIVDRPKFAHRGLLLDTARNFIPTNSLKRHIEAMAASKMNVFHWHITDTQSFPLQLDTIPEMASYGAYTNDAVYSPDDVKEIVQYAKTRGIRVIIEIDAPAHAGNGWQWGPEKGLGDLAVCINKQPWRKFCIEPPCGQLNPANPNLYHVLHHIYFELFNLTIHEHAIHMGGDEVFVGCWNDTEEIINYMKRQGMGQNETDFLNLWSEYQEKVLQIWDNVTSRAKISSVKTSFEESLNQPSAPVILWSSSLTDPTVIRQFLSNKRYIIQTWVPSSSNLPQELQKLDYKIIVSTKDAWYLDHGFWGVTKYYNWQTVYNNRLPTGNGVLGGEEELGHAHLQQLNGFGQILLQTPVMQSHVFSLIAIVSSFADYSLKPLLQNGVNRTKLNVTRKGLFISCFKNYKTLL
uniref:beta-N-acetylhexosaminidase n=1 Tax=Anopheles farauti TaxID=69004 RepID=A0A182QJ60_9DIPT